MTGRHEFLRGTREIGWIERSFFGVFFMGELTDVL